MKKAYNETWVDDEVNLDTIRTWANQKKLSDDEYQSATKLFPSAFYRPNFFVKIGLFIFSLVAISATWGFLYIFLLEPFTTSQFSFAVVCLCYAAGLFALLEYTIKNNFYYRSGTDNAILYSALSFILVAVFAFTNFELQNWAYCALTIAVFTPALMRYGDPLVSIGIYVNLIALIFIWITKYEVGKTILPFVIMAVSAGVYSLTIRWKNGSKTSYYTDAQEVILTLSLATSYLGGNYFVVREGNALLNDLSTSTQINLSFLFYFFTIAIPAAYMYLGLKQKERKLFIVGLITAVISVVTFLHYFSTIPGEWESTTGGILLILLAVGAIKFLKEAKNNITSEADDNENPRNFEALIISQIAQSGSGKQDGLNFGAGDFGGGGAGNEY